VRQAAPRPPPDADAAESPWLPLLAGVPPFAEAEPASRYVAIPGSREARVPFDEDAIAAALADEARGRRHFPGYRAREEQVRMAREFVRPVDAGATLLP